jgi:membrane protein YqaA with SNARE-associated domain
MSDWLQSLVEELLHALALPKFGLTTIFVVSLISATLLPLGSEPAVFGLLKLRPDLFWETILVATVGNTLGGVIDYWMGYGAKAATSADRPTQQKALQWLQRFGPKAMLLAWLPGVGDPLCAVAGWLKMPFWPSTTYMLIGKFLRYLVYTPLLLWVFPGQLHV